MILVGIFSSLKILHNALGIISDISDKRKAFERFSSLVGNFALLFLLDFLKRMLSY